jgi:hypothetical protein
VGSRRRADHLRLRGRSAAERLKILPWVEFVVTKKATSASTVELRPVDEVHAEMREKAAPCGAQHLEGEDHDAGDANEGRAARGSAPPVSRR